MLISQGLRVNGHHRVTHRNNFDRLEIATTFVALTALGQTFELSANVGSSAIFGSFGHMIITKLFSEIEFEKEKLIN